MMNKTFENKIPICIGDTHTLKMVPIFQEKLPGDFKNGVFFHCGDAGEGFYHPIKDRYHIKKLHEFIKSIDSHLIICRGNHSNPSFFHDNHWANKEFSDRIYFCPDYSVFLVNGKKIQIVGGGISIDRIQRTINKDWWSNEEVNFCSEYIEKVDILITHVAPTNAQISKAETNEAVLNFHSEESMQGGDLLGDLLEEQKKVQNISNLSECDKHIFGHYHIYHFMVDLETKRQYIGLAINEFREITL